MQQGAGAHEAEFGGGGGKATRRKGRDMERALARGDLGALGNEVRKNNATLFDQLWFLPKTCRVGRLKDTTAVRQARSEGGWHRVLQPEAWCYCTGAGGSRGGSFKTKTCFRDLPGDWIGTCPPGTSPDACVGSSLVTGCGRRR